MEEGKGNCPHGEFDLSEGCLKCVAERKAEAEVNSPENIAKRIKEAEERASTHVLSEVEKVAPPVSIVKVQYYSETTKELSSREYTYYSVDQLKVGDIITVPVRDTATKAQVSAIDVPETEIANFKDKVKTIPAGSIITKSYVMPEEMRGVKISPNAARLVDDIAEKLQEPNTKINLCDTCSKRNDYPICCPSDIAFGDGKGNDNVIQCSKYVNGPAAPCTIPLNVEIRPEQRGMEEGLNSEGLTLANIGEPVTITESLLEETDGMAVALRPGEDIEVHGYYEESKRMLEYAEKRVVTTLEESESANDDLALISKLTKLMDDKRKALLAPLEAQKVEIRNTYKYLMAPIIEANTLTRGKMLAYDTKQRQIQQEQERINQQRLAAAQAEMNLKGELTESVNLMEVTEAPKKVSTDMGTSSKTDRWKYRIDNPALLPREYMIPDDAMLSLIAKRDHDKKPIAGVTFFNDPFYTVRAK